MDQYVDYTWYTTEYLSGRDPVIAGNLFDYYATKATAEIRNCVSLDADLSDPADEVKAATCEVAEILCRMDGSGQTDSDAHSIPVGVSSEKVGEYSVTYVNNTGTGKAQEQNHMIQRALVHWLGPTGLLYRGV